MFYSNGEIINCISNLLKDNTDYVPYINYLINIGPLDRIAANM